MNIFVYIMVLLAASEAVALADVRLAVDHGSAWGLRRVALAKALAEALVSPRFVLLRVCCVGRRIEPLVDCP